MTTLIFTTSSSLLSRVIRWFTRSACSHVAIGTELAGMPVLVHATAGGVQVTARSEWLASNQLVAEYAFRRPSDASLRHALKHLGEKYDYLALIGFAVAIAAWRLLKVWMRNPFASPRAMVCSEFVLHLDHAGRIPEWRGLDPERTHAQDLLTHCEEEVSFVRV
jgi:hypothetical protein